MNRQGMRRDVGIFKFMVLAAVSLPVIVLVILVLLQVSGSLMSELVPVLSGVGGAEPSDVSDGLGNAWIVLTVGLLVIPLTVFLVLQMRGRVSSGGQNQFEGRGGF